MKISSLLFVSLTLGESFIKRRSVVNFNEKTDHEIYEQYMFLYQWQAQKYFERAKNKNDTLRIAISLFDRHNQDISTSGKTLLDGFNLGIFDRNPSMNLVGSLQYFDIMFASTLDNVRAVYFNQLRQIELIQHTAHEQAREALSAKDPDFLQKSYEHQEAMYEVRQLAMQSMKIAHKDHEDLLDVLELKAKSIFKQLQGRKERLIVQD